MKPIKQPKKQAKRLLATRELRAKREVHQRLTAEQRARLMEHGTKALKVGAYTAAGVLGVNAITEGVKRYYRGQSELETAKASRYEAEHPAAGHDVQQLDPNGRTFYIRDNEGAARVVYLDEDGGAYQDPTSGAPTPVESQLNEPPTEQEEMAQKFWEDLMKPMNLFLIGAAILGFVLLRKRK